MPLLEITVHGHLLVAGGQASESGADLSTSRRLVAGKRVPYIPATALRGAVRIQLEALLNGGGLGHEVVEPYPFDGPTVPAIPPPKGSVARLFGFSGRSGERRGSREGALRFSDAMPVDIPRAQASLRVRPGLELDNFTATAEDQKLFFREVAEISAEPLVFQALLSVVEPAKLKEQDLTFLRVAVESTDSIGAGKSKGGGEISIRWIDQETPTAVRIQGDTKNATRARLLFTLAEPAHFGDGGPYGNHHATRTYIPGATVRGAVAWSLLRNGRVKAEDDAFKSLFLEGPPASFGDALLVHDPQAEPALFSATAGQRRGGKGHLRNTLATELARQRINEELAEAGAYLRADDGSDRFDPMPSRPSDGLMRQTRTRVSIDRWTGAAAEGRLFSIEHVDPSLFLNDQIEVLPARFVGWVEGLTPATAGLLAGLEGLTLLVGAGRNHGLGLVELEVRFESDPLEDFEREVRSFAAALESCVSGLARRAGIGHSPKPGARLPLVLVALSDYVPSGKNIDHPLAEREAVDSVLDISGPDRRFLHASAAGGYDQRPEDRAPLKDLLPAVGAGSVFVYSVAESDLKSTLDRLMPVLRRGVGQRVDSGCGRFGLFEPEATKESKMSSQPEDGLKSWMVGQAESILNKVKGDSHFKNATSQLRNLVQITQQESEVAVLENFLNYQRGRRATRDFWKLIHEPVVGVLKEIEKKTSSQIPEVRRSAIQQFFGYLVRHYVYLDELNLEAHQKNRPPTPRGERREAR
jgi:CRISPR-associated Csx10 family RAMP protein